MLSENKKRSSEAKITGYQETKEISLSSKSNNLKNQYDIIF
ncbi:hypothetical protein XSR1_190067 [Xenorhabdus szentirmaii DSM 16338]|uniref:Uncharacterized protein n=1 Tax=Xenorhabdus szentirmaii DSM 16338 TaxID=1427518 RepID=W1IY37_9GAMM|nr:hypothetical protein XSR1_190067 [Xenorhabdus szentirmaii DSM 16338]